MGTRNNTGKILSIYLEIPETGVFSNSKWATRVPSTTIHQPPSTRYIKKSWYQKRSILEGVFEIKKVFLGEDIRPKEIKLGPRRGPPKGWSRPPGDKFLLWVTVIWDDKKDKAGIYPAMISQFSGFAKSSQMLSV